ncbi:MAG: hypothetical protein M9899_08855 [Bdellovibrionaceae bacterium]|nr:hypothetical protein [Pseudobdellovibrionaceae bacterium]
MVEFNELLDQVFTHFSGPGYQDRLTLAKQSYVDFAGPFDEDQIDIESKWIQFRDWYLYDFLYQGTSCISMVHEVPEISEDLKESLQQARSSIYYFYKESRGWVYFRDLITRDKIYFKNTDAILLLEKNRYIQTRLFRYNKDWYAGAYLTVHPQGSEKFIDSKVKLIRKEKNIEVRLEMKIRLLDLIFRRFFQNLRFKQVDVRKIYADEPLFDRKAETRI